MSRNPLELTARRLGLLGKNDGILWQFQGTYVVYRACGHDEERFTLKGDGTVSNHPTSKCSNKRHWSFAQIFIKWLKDKARAKTFSESWTLLVMNWQFKMFYSISFIRTAESSSRRSTCCVCVCVCVCVCLCLSVGAPILYRKVVFQPLDQLIDFHEIRCKTYGGSANLWGGGDTSVIYSTSYNFFFSDYRPLAIRGHSSWMITIPLYSYRTKLFSVNQKLQIWRWCETLVSCSVKFNVYRVYISGMSA